MKGVGEATTLGAIASVCDPGEDRSFDHYARLTRRLLSVPTALVSIVEQHRQVFPGMVGLPEPYASTRETPLTYSFCQHVVQDQQPLIIVDARVVPRLRGNLAISDLSVVAYAGWPLVDANGRTVGSLCAIDSVPRAWTDEELSLLEDLALACSAELQQSRRVALDGEHLARTILGTANVAMAFYDTEERLLLANRGTRQPWSPLRSGSSARTARRGER
jgi:GAF domain-containing protein